MTSSTVRSRGVAVVCALAVSLAACGSSDGVRSAEEEPNVSVPSADSVEPALTTLPTTDSVVDGGIEILKAVRGVDYYGACGNEILELDRETWYPIVPVDFGGEPFDPSPYAPLPPAAQQLVRVAPPGPGDDSGTLYVFTDGIARFVSDSGTIDLWMTTEEQEYLWAC